MKDLSTTTQAFEAVASSKLHEVKARFDEIAAHTKGRVAGAHDEAIAEIQNHHMELEDRLGELRSTASGNTETVKKAIQNGIRELTTQLSSLQAKLKHSTEA